MFVIAILWAAFFVVNFNIAMMIPLLPFIQDAVGISTRQAGVILAVFPIVALFGNLILGPWIDRFGRRPFLITGSIACTAIFLMTAAASSGTTLVATRAVIGLFMPMLGASVFAAVADYVPMDRRGRAAAYVATAAPAAFLLSMSLGVLLGGYISWRLPILLIAGLTAVIAIGALRLPRTPGSALSGEPITARTYKRRFLSLSLGTSTRLLLLGHFCWSMAMFVFLGLYPAWLIQHALADRGPGTISGMLFLGEVGGLAGAFYSGRLPALRGRPLGVCAVASVATAAVVLTIPFGSGMLAFQAIAYAGYSFGRDLMLAPITSGAMALVAPTERGSLNAILNSVYQSGATSGAIVSAALYAARPDFMANALVSAVIFIVAAFSLWRIRTGGVAA